MNKPVIGIISNRNEGEENRPFTRNTNFSSLIAEKISNFYALPVGIIFPYGVYDVEAMKMCDGFIFQGGSKIELCQLLAMKYVIENQKPVVGICNGMQTMVGYDYIIQNVSNPTENNIARFYDSVGEDAFLHKVDGHNVENPFYIQNIKNAKHNIYFDGDDNTFADYYGTNIITGLSLHNYACNETVLSNSKIFKVSGISNDGVIEAIESIDSYYYALGVQYHMEIDEQGNKIFRNLVEESNYIRKLKK